MGGGTYSNDSREIRYSNLATEKGYKDVETFMADKENIFESRALHADMNPKNLGIRESRDSDEHPNSLAIIIALDVTGSMGSIPHHLVKEGLPSIMEGIIKAGIPDPQVLFLGIGDTNYDSAPLQVGQFESSDELLDKWLTAVYLEGGGGGNDGESYHLAWYAAANHTSIDCFEKRKQKGLLFTIGDEPVLETLPKRHMEGLMGKGQFHDMKASELLEEASKMYETFHIHISETFSGKRPEVADGWKQLISSNLIVAQKHTQVPDIIKDTVIANIKPESTTNEITTKPTEESNEDEILL
jgi:hypothetical protein